MKPQVSALAALFICSRASSSFITEANSHKGRLYLPPSPLRSLFYLSVYPFIRRPVSVGQPTSVALTVIAESPFRHINDCYCLFNPTCSVKLFKQGNYNKWQTGNAELDRDGHFKRLKHKSLRCKLKDKGRRRCIFFSLSTNRWNFTFVTQIYIFSRNQTDRVEKLRSIARQRNCCWIISCFVYLFVFWLMLQILILPAWRKLFHPVHCPIDISLTL